MNASPQRGAVPAFHVMAKPVGPICNLNCGYCFYLEKKRLVPRGPSWVMSREVLEQFVRQTIEGHRAPVVQFAWQGGEPTLLGVEFFRRVIELQAKYANGKRIENAIQTNGTLLDDRFCEFLAENDFLVGLSLDGPRELHDSFRLDRKRRPTFDTVMRGLALLRKHQVNFNTLSVVSRANAEKPLEVYRFLKDAGSRFIQFIPLVEREAPPRLKAKGLELMGPPLPGRNSRERLPVTRESVEPMQYGRFLIAVFDEWIRNDVDSVFVQQFDCALGQWAGLGSSICVFSERCGAALALEHDGDLFSCDHYVYPEYRLGSILERPLIEMVESARQRRFGAGKFETLPGHCRRCEVLFACNGGCPKHRFLRTPGGKEGLNYLCAGFRAFFRHIDPAMRTLSRRPGAAP